MGESDVKFVRYVHMLGNSIVYATDGDYMAISLLYYAMHGLNTKNNILLYRQEANIDGMIPKPTTKIVGKKKTAVKATTATTSKRKMEFVNMQEVFHSILKITPTSSTENPAVVMTSFVTTMLLCGKHARGNFIFDVWCCVKKNRMQVPITAAHYP